MQQIVVAVVAAVLALWLAACCGAGAARYARAGVSHAPALPIVAAWRLTRGTDDASGSSR